MEGTKDALDGGGAEDRKYAVISNFRSKDKMISGNVDIDLIQEHEFKIY